MPELTIQSAFCHERRVSLGHRIVIGRATDSDLFVPDKRLSRHHAELQQRPDGYWVIDLGSTNGTYLNGARIDGERPLRHSDVIAVGATTLTFHDLAPGIRLTHAFDAPGLSDRTVAQPNLPTTGTRRTLSLRALGTGDGTDGHRLLAVLGRATTELVQPLPLPDLFARVVDVLLTALPADRAAILLAPDAGEPAWPSRSEAPATEAPATEAPARIVASRSRNGAPPVTYISAQLANRVIGGQMTLLLQDIDADRDLKARDSVVAAGIRSVLCAPLWLREGAAADSPARVLGLVYLDCHDGRDAFGADDLQIVTVLANLAAARIENARLVADRAERAKLEEEMRLAAEIQATILPAVAPSPPGYDLACGTRSCRAVGGDYYDFALDGNGLDLAIGDVSGKGVAAAMLMAALRASVRSCWRGAELPGVMAQVNATFRQCVPEDRFATFFLARLELDSGRVCYVNAGHNQPLVVRDGGVDRLTEGGTILGAFEHPSYTRGDSQLSRGDTLVLFSDGISDAFDDAAEADACMADLARRLHGQGAAAVQQAIFDETERRAGACGAPPRDDRTVMVLRRL